jgi:hypothetical protein
LLAALVYAVDAFQQKYFAAEAKNKTKKSQKS